MSSIGERGDEIGFASDDKWEIEAVIIVFVMSKSSVN